VTADYPAPLDVEQVIEMISIQFSINKPLSYTLEDVDVALDWSKKVQVSNPNKTRTGDR